MPGVDRRTVHRVSLRIDHIPGSPQRAGFTHGRLIRDLVEPAFLGAYTSALSAAIGFDLATLREQGMRWVETLPVHFAEEIAAMACGAGVPLGPMVDLLYADIAKSNHADRPSGPMCSALTARLDDGHRWVGRNCDWLTPTLMRGVSAVVHESPSRIPIMAVGIRGDLDVDTGLNAEGLWLHLHTLHATDGVPTDRPSISWLFWAREALETCATLDELERFIETTGRDRGVFVIAAEAKNGRGAVFECARSAHTRYDASDSTPFCITNHTLARPERRVVAGSPNASGTVSRRQALQGIIDAEAPTRGPSDLIDALGAPGVEMRTPKWLRTIYSAVANPREQTVWFAAGTPCGQPAASMGQWSAVRPPWA